MVIARSQSSYWDACSDSLYVCESRVEDQAGVGFDVGVGRVCRGTDVEGSGENWRLGSQRQRKQREYDRNQGGVRIANALQVVESSA